MTLNEHSTIATSLSCTGDTCSEGGKKEDFRSLGPGNDSVLGSRVLESSYSLKSLQMPVTNQAGGEAVQDGDDSDDGRIRQVPSFDQVHARIEKNATGKEKKHASGSDGDRTVEESPCLKKTDVQEESTSKKEDSLHYCLHVVAEEITPFDQPDVEPATDYQPQAECGSSTGDSDDQMREEPFRDSPTVQTMRISSNMDSRSERRGEDDVREEESLLTAMIEKSITSESDKGGSVVVPPREKKSKSKAKKRKLSEDSTLSKQDKISKSRRKKERRQSEDEMAKKDAKQNEKRKRKKERRASEDLAKSKEANDDSRSNAEKGVATTRGNKCKTSMSDDTNISGRPPRAAASDSRSRETKLENAQLRKAQKKEKKRCEKDAIREQVGVQTEVAIDVDQNFEANPELARNRKYSITSIDSSDNSDSQCRARRPSPSTVPRTASLATSRQHSKVNVASSFSKAGPGAVKSAKLKRLWPDSSVFSKRILKWAPPTVIIEDFKVRFKGAVKSSSKSKLPVIPSTFRDTSELIKYISPHILEEGIHSVKQEFMANSDKNGLWSRDMFAMNLRVSHYSVIYICRG
jgi:hypothetical protein